MGNPFRIVPMNDFPGKSPEGTTLIENGSILGFFGSIRALARKISQRDYFKRIPHTQNMCRCKILVFSRMAPFLGFLDSLERISMHFGLPRPKNLKYLVILRRFSCAVYGQILILLCGLRLCHLRSRCAIYG